MDTEPERLLPLLTTESAKTLPFIADFLQPYLRREAEAGRVRPGVDLDRAAEYLARAILSLIGAPGRWDLDDPVQVAHLVEVELLGGINAPWPPPAPTLHGYPRKTPRAPDAVEGVLAAIVEVDRTAEQQIAHRGRDPQLAVGRARLDARCEVHRDTGDIAVGVVIDLSRVNAGADRHVDREQRRAQ